MVRAGSGNPNVKNDGPTPLSALSSEKPVRRTQHQQRVRCNHDESRGSGMAFLALVGAVIVLLFAIVLSPDIPFYKQRGSGEDIDGNAGQHHPGVVSGPPVRKYAGADSDNNNNNGGGGGGGTADHNQEANSASGPFCYTLEEYSTKFVTALTKRRSPVQNWGTRATASQHFYRCGTRITDLHAELNSSKVKLCSATNTPTSFPRLRVYLNSAFEVRLHLEQARNIAAQIIHLERLNDEYCDCIDGTDELQTSACSMSGAVSPLSRERWKQYLTANAHVQLYEEEEAPSSSRTERLLRRLGGPVLPFRCRDDPDVWLAPSRVGDGVVDCCDASDELQDPHQEQWKLRVANMAQYLHLGSGDTSLLHPVPSDSRSVATTLLDKDLTALMTCHRVKEERLRHARALHAIVKKGHVEFKLRKANGWEHYGKGFLEDNTQLQLQLKNISFELEELRKYIGARMSEARVEDPLAAGVPSEELERFMRLYGLSQQYQMRIRYVHMILQHRWLGNDFEFYPLVSANYSFPLHRVVNTAYSTSDVVQEWLELYRYNYTYARQAPPVHVDNTSYRSLMLLPYLYMLGITEFAGRDEEEKKEAARLGSHSGEPGNTESSSTAPEGKNDGKEEEENSYGQFVMFGHWQPDRVELSVDNFTSVDPAGSTVLRERLLISDPLPVMGGFEQVLPHERFSHARRHRRLMRIEMSRSSEERLKKASAGIKDEITVELLPHENTPDTASVRIFRGGLDCSRVGAGGNSTQHATEDEEEGGHDKVVLDEWKSHGRVVFACAVKDGVLAWHRNGKCSHEVVFGTPSACPSWTLEKAALRLQVAEDALRYESGV